MRHDHISFERLCALAAGDRLTQAQLVELQDHCAGCDVCREQFLEVKKMGAELFLVYARQEAGQRTPTGMRDRFLTRANREGIQLKSPAKKLSPFSISLLSAVALIVITITAVSSWRILYSPRVFIAGTNQGSGVQDVAGRDENSSQTIPTLLQTREVLPTTAVHRRLNARSRHDESDDVFVQTPSVDPHRENPVAAKTSGITLVMYTPQPRSSSDSISTMPPPISASLLTRTYRNIYPSLMSENKIVETWIRQDAGEFAHSFLFNKEQSLLKGSSETQQSSVQDASLPSRVFNLRLTQPDFRIP